MTYLLRIVPAVIVAGIVHIIITGPFHDITAALAAGN